MVRVSIVAVRDAELFFARHCQIYRHPDGARITCPHAPSSDSELSELLYFSGLSSVSEPCFLATIPGRLWLSSVSEPGAGRGIR